MIFFNKMHTLFYPKQYLFIPLINLTDDDDGTTLQLGILDHSLEISGARVFQEK